MNRNCGGRLRTKPRGVGCVRLSFFWGGMIHFSFISYVYVSLKRDISGVGCSIAGAVFAIGKNKKNENKNAKVEVIA